MSDALAPGTRLGPYEIGSLIGAGAMGQVYRALDPRLGRHVAIKTLSGAAGADPERVRRFETEARAAGTLDHPNLLVVYDVGREGAVSYIVSELLEGETLRERLRTGAVPEREAVDFATQIARGLAVAHERGIVHRDLKPENIFVTRDRRVKILDFGVAKLVRAPGPDDQTLAAPQTELGVVVGTVGYMAPEQVRGEPIDHRADIFALGVVMHEMLSGAHPFRRETTAETLTAILKDDPPGLPANAAPALERVVARCLEKRRDDRFHSAHDLGLALELVSPGTPSGTTRVSNQPTSTVSRRALLYGAASLGVLASGLGGAMLDRRLRPAAGLPSFRRVTFRRGVIRSARLAPDGLTILYGALWDGDRCRVHTVRVDSPESRPLDHLPDGNLLAISRSGELAIALGSHSDGVVTYGTLARVPMAGGAPREMVEGVKFADWSPDGADLAIVRSVDGRDRLEFPIGSVLVQPDAGENTGLGFARVSPDGRRVAFVQYRSPTSLLGRVSIVDGTGAVKTLSDEYLNIHGLTWNGDEIWYTAADEQPLFRALRAVTPGGAGRTIARTPGNATLWDAAPDGRLVIAQTDDRAVVIARRREDVDDRDLSWLDASWIEDISHDGRLLLFTESGQGGGPKGAVYLRGTDGSEAVRLGEGRGLALSPDTQWALGLSDLHLPSPDLELLPTAAGEPRRFPGNGLLLRGAAWLPDGRRIVVSAAEPGHGARLYLQDLESDRRTPFTPEGVTSWVVSPDGSTVAARGPAPAIRLYPVDGSASRDLPGGTGREVPIGWIHDGLLITRPGDPEAPRGEIYRVDIRTGRQESWKNILPRDPSGILLLVSFRVSPDGRSQAYTWHRALSNLYVADGLA